MRVSHLEEHMPRLRSAGQDELLVLSPPAPDSNAYENYVRLSVT
jgi:hypothetical protein